MKKLEVLKTLKRLRSVYEEFPDGLQAIALLESLADTFPDQKNGKDLDWNSSFSLPDEMRELPCGYAIFADGACRGNPGPGAWAVMIQNEKGEVILKSSGVDMPTTNNKMELEGVIRGLKGLIEKWVEDGMSDHISPVFVYSDSKYVTEGVSSWVKGWKSRGWKKADGKEPENIVLWKELDGLTASFDNIKFIWVKGHAGHPQNEMCDKMCNLALDEAGF